VVVVMVVVLEGPHFALPVEGHNLALVVLIQMIDPQRLFLKMPSLAWP
jgi:hypothetical protein